MAEEFEPEIAIRERPEWGSNKETYIENWKGVLKDLGGSPDSLSTCENEFMCDVLHEIRKIEGGTGQICKMFLQNDVMSFTHYDIARLYLNMTEDLYIKQKKTQTIYTFNMQTNLWEEPTNLKGTFIEVMTTYMDGIVHFSPNQHLFPDEKKYYELKCKYRAFIKQDSTINAILNIFKSVVGEVDTKFDLEPEYKNIICFKNGLYNLDTNTFACRNRYDMFTKCLDFDFKPSYDKMNYNEIDDFFKKIQPDVEQRTFTASYLKYCLKGGNPQGIFKMNIGFTASNGKSSEMNIHEMVFPLYTNKLNKSTFNKNCTKVHKYMSKLVNHPIRLAYINELDDSKLDEDFLKDVVDGKKLELEKMYSTMTEESELQCAIITTSNKDPNIDVDPGVLRRMTMQHYDSRFVPQQEVNEEKHLYLDDKTWTEDRFSQDSYKLAYFHYLQSMPELVVPATNKRLVKEFVEENDNIMGTLTEHFEVTKQNNDKVQQQEVTSLFPEYQKQKLNRELKRHGIIYDKTSSHCGVRKVYRGLKSIPIDTHLHVDDPE